MLYLNISKAAHYYFNSLVINSLLIGFSGAGFIVTSFTGFLASRYSGLFDEKRVNNEKKNIFTTNLK